MRTLRGAVCLLSTAVVACAASVGGRSGRPPSPAVTAAPPPVASSGPACAAPPADALAPVSPSAIFASTDFQASRDGHVVAARATPVEIQIWNVTASAKVASIAAAAAIDAFALSPDGCALATASEGRLLLRDLVRGQSAPVDLKPGAITTLSWVNDGRELVVGRPTGTDSVELLGCGADHPIGGAVRATLPAVAVAGGVGPDGRSLLARDGSMFDLDTGKVRWRWPAEPRGAAFSGDGRTVALSVGSPDPKTNHITVVDVATGTKRWVAAPRGPVAGVILNRDGTSLAAVEDGMEPSVLGVVLWTRGKRVHTWRSPESREGRSSFSHDGTRLAFVTPASALGDRISIARVGTGLPVALRELAAAELRGDMPPVWTDDGGTILQADSNGGLAVYDVARGSHRLLGARESPAYATVQADFAFAPDDSSVVVLQQRSSGRTVARLWDLGSGRLRGSLDYGAFTAVEFSPDGSRIALCGSDGVRLWDGRSDRPTAVLDGDRPNRAPCGAVFGPAGQLLATYEVGGSEVRVWDPLAAKRVQTISLGDDGVEAVAFSHDGALLAVTGHQREILLYDPRSGAPVRTLHTGSKSPAVEMRALHWGPKGHAIVSVGAGTVALWSAATDDPPETLIQGGGELSEALGLGAQGGPSELSADGNMLVMGSRILGLWDLRATTRVWELVGDRSLIGRIRIRDGGRIVAAGRPDHVDLYRVSDGAHATLRVSPTEDPTGPMLLYTDDGAFAGDASAYGTVKVRASANELEVRSLRPDELRALYRPTLLADFMAGCPLGTPR